MRNKILRWIRNNVAKVPDGQANPLWLRRLWRILHPLTYFYEKQAGIRYDITTNTYTINGRKYSKAFFDGGLRSGVYRIVFGEGDVVFENLGYVDGKERMEMLYDVMGRFAKETFPDNTAIEHLKVLKKEAVEAMESLQTEEFADCLLALFAACSDANITYKHLGEMADYKLRVNMRRTWEKMPDGTYHHVDEKIEV